MNYETVDNKTAVIFTEDIDNVFKATYDVAKTLNLKCAKATQDYLPLINITDKENNLISQLLLIKTGEEEILENRPDIELPETTKTPVEKPVKKMTDEIIKQYQQGLKYAKKALSDIIDEFNNEIVLRELLLNNYREGRSTLELGSGVIKPLIQKALRGKTQKSFTPYGKGSKKHVKDFLKGDKNEEPGKEAAKKDEEFFELDDDFESVEESKSVEETETVEEITEPEAEVEEIEEGDPLLEETMKSVDKFFSKMQRGLSKRERGGIGITTDEEAAQVEEDQQVFEKGKEVLIQLMRMISSGVLGSPKDFYGEKGSFYQQTLDTLFSLINTTYLIFAEQKYEYRDDMATYLQVTVEKAKQFIQEYRSLISIIENNVQKI